MFALVIKRGVSVLDLLLAFGMVIQLSLLLNFDVIIENFVLLEFALVLMSLLLDFNIISSDISLILKLRKSDKHDLN